MKYERPKPIPLSADELAAERREFLERRAQRDEDALKRIRTREESEERRNPWPYPRGQRKARDE